MKNTNCFLIILLLLISCNRKTSQIIYQDKIVKQIDTIILKSLKNDTIPCNDFDLSLLDKDHDTVFIKVVDRQISIRYLKRSDTIYREVTIISTPLLSVNKINNSVKNKATKGSAIGDGNTITTKKITWWWIFFAGALTWFIIQNIFYKTLKNYIKF